MGNKNPIPHAPVSAETVEEIRERRARLYSGQRRGYRMKVQILKDIDMLLSALASERERAEQAEREVEALKEQQRILSGTVTQDTGTIARLMGEVAALREAQAWQAQPNPLDILTSREESKPHGE